MQNTKQYYLIASRRDTRTKDNLRRVCITTTTSASYLWGCATQPLLSEKADGERTVPLLRERELADSFLEAEQASTSLRIVFTVGWVR